MKSMCISVGMYVESKKEGADSPSDVDVPASVNDPDLFVPEECLCWPLVSASLLYAADRNSFENDSYKFLARTFPGNVS